MINYTTGDLLQSGAQALVNTVNCVGVMGKGIALHFKQAFPHNFAVYADACRRGEVQPGRMLVVDDRSEEFGNHLIVNFPTKQHWRNPSQYEWVEAGLRDLVRVIREQHISSIAIPPLGCGNGGLDWSRVKPMIEQALSTLDDVAVTVYEPSAAAAATLAGREQQSDARLTPARAMLLYAMFCYEAHDERCSLFVANKLSYFYQMLGEESFARIPFVAHYYGPYSVSVGHMLSAVNGKYLHGLEEMDRKPFEALMLDYGRKAEVGEYVHTRLSATISARCCGSSMVTRAPTPLRCSPLWPTCARNTPALGCPSASARCKAGRSASATSSSPSTSRPPTATWMRG